MKYDPDKHHRRSIRLKGYDYSQDGAYFVTICTYQKACLFGDVVGDAVILSDYGKIVKEEWVNTPQIRPYVELDAFVVMPNHFHGIIFIINNAPVRATRCVAPTHVAPTHANGPPPKSLGAIIGGFKSMVTKRINILHDTPGGQVWQRNYYESIIRNERMLNARQQYVELNPARWSTDENYPF